MWDLVVFAAIGLLTGAASRLCYQDKKPVNIAGTMLLGMAGALVGGLISWGIWHSPDSELFFGALALSLFGAVLALGVWPWIAFVKGNSLRDPPPTP